MRFLTPILSGVAIAVFAVGIAFFPGQHLHGSMLGDAALAQCPAGNADGSCGATAGQKCTHGTTPTLCANNFNLRCTCGGI